MVNSLQSAPAATAKEQILTRERILDAVSEQLERTGIAGLRLKDVADLLNVSVPSLYRFFADREAMIAAAYVRDFAEQTFIDLDQLRIVFSGAATAEDYRNGLRTVVVDIFGEHSRQIRWRKLSAMAATHHDPVLMEQIGRIQAEFTSRIAEMFEAARQRGWVKNSINALAFAYAVQGLTMGPLFADVAPGPNVTSEDFAEIFVLFHQSMAA
jgi:AcrR family transcriptional regulator